MTSLRCAIRPEMTWRIIGGTATYPGYGLRSGQKHCSATGPKSLVPRRYRGFTNGAHRGWGFGSSHGLENIEIRVVPAVGRFWSERPGSVRTRLLAGYLSLVLLLAGSWVVAASSAGRVRASYEHAVRVDSALIDNIDLRTKLLDDEETGSRGYLLTYRDGFLQPYRAAKRQLPSVRAESTQLLRLSTPRVRQLGSVLEKRGKAWEKWASLILSMPEIISTRAFLIQMDRGKHLFDLYRATAAALERTLNQDRREDLTASDHTIDTMNLILAGVFGGAIILLLVVGSITVRSITKPLDDLGRSAELMGRGDLSQPVQVTGAREFATLATTMEAMRLARKETEEALHTKTREQDTFIYTVSHDLRAPLVSLQWLVNILVEDYGSTLDAEALRYLDRIDANAVKMQGLLSDLLDLARIGRVETEMTPLDLGAVVAGVVDQLEPTLRARGAEVVVSDPLPLVQGNSTRLGQLFTNLIDNALRYTAPDIRPVIQIAASDRGAVWEITVADNGVGIDPASQGKVFGLFQRLPAGKALNPGGTGAGLAIVARVVETHAGDLWLESDEGAGCTFHFTLAKARRLPDAETSLLIGQTPTPTSFDSREAASSRL